MVVKEYELTRLRKFQVLGLPIHEICQVMKISRATYFRYMRRIHKQDKEMMLRDAENKMISTIQTFQDRIGHTVLAMSEIEKDKEKTDFVRMQAARIKLEATWAGAMLQAEGPTIITKMTKTVRDIAYGKKRAPITDEQLAQIKTEMIPQNEQQRQDHNDNPDNVFVLGEANRYGPPKPPPLPEPPLGDWGKPPQEQEEGEEDGEEEFDPTQDPDPDPSFTQAWSELQKKRREQQEQQGQ